MQRGQALMGEGSTFLGTCHMQLWMAAVPGTWKRGAREKLLHVKLSSLLPGYFCHMLVFTAFLLPPSDCTHSIYSTTYKTRSVSLVYAIKSLKFQEDAPGANAICAVSYWLREWASGIAPSQRSCLSPSFLSCGKKCYSNCSAFLLLSYILAEVVFCLILESHNSWKRLYCMLKGKMQLTKSRKSKRDHCKNSQN